MGIEFSANPLMWVVRLLFASIFIVISSLIITSFISQDIQTDQLEMQLFTQELYYSHLFMHQDPITFRVYPGIVDLEKFENLDLSGAITTQRRDLAVRMLLSYEGEEVEAYYVPGREEEEYEVFAALSSYNEQVIRFNPFPLKQLVTIKTPEGMKEGELTTWVLIQT